MGVNKQKIPVSSWVEDAKIFINNIEKEKLANNIKSREPAKSSLNKTPDIHNLFIQYKNRLVKAGVYLCITLGVAFLGRFLYINQYEKAFNDNLKDKYLKSTLDAMAVKSLNHSMETMFPGGKDTSTATIVNVFWGNSLQKPKYLNKINDEDILIVEIKGKFNLNDLEDMKYMFPGLILKGENDGDIKLSLSGTFGNSTEMGFLYKIRNEDKSLFVKGAHYKLGIEQNDAKPGKWIMLSNLIIK